MALASSSLRGRVIGAGAVLLAFGCLTALIGPVFSRGLDRNQQCVSNLAAISRGINNYAQDWDEHLPLPVAFTNITLFQNFVGPYFKDNSILRCPANGNLPYLFNAALGGKTLTEFPDLYTVEVARDSKPHPDGKLTVTYLDGHAERGGILQFHLDITCRENVQRIAQGIDAYTQDYDEHTPFQQDDDAFRQAAQPYTYHYYPDFSAPKGFHIWTCPDTQQLYNIGKDFRGRSLASFPDNSAIIVLQDSVAHRNGVVTTAYLDFYVEQRGPKGVTYPYPMPSPESSLANFRKFGSALRLYIQDYDERLPVYKDYPDLLSKLYPDYLGHSSRALRELSQPTYQADPMFSGVTQASIEFPASSIILRDVYDFGDGLITVGYLDGHAERIAYKRQDTMPELSAHSGPGKVKK